MALSYAIFLLLKEEIKSQDIKTAEKLLEFFVGNLEQLYGKESLTYNAHQLLHLGLSVERYGPLWATSTFLFEHQNGMLNNTSHATNFLKEEVINNVILYQNYEILKNQINFENNSYPKEDCMLGKAVGEGKLFTAEEEKRFFFGNIIEGDDLKFYLRARIQGLVFTSVNYKTISTNNYTVYIYLKDKTKLFAKIRFFYFMEGEMGVLIEKLKIDRANMLVHTKTGILIDSVLPVLKSGNKEFKLLKISDIKIMNHVVEVDDFICKQPNSLNLHL